VIEQQTVRELRPILREAELAVAHVDRGSSVEELLALYGLLDRIAVTLPQLEQAGAAVEAEQVRLETICAILSDKRRSVARTFRQGGGLPTYRQQNLPPEDHWWWYLDQQVAREQAQHRRRLLRGTLIASAIVALLAILYVVFLRPDEATRLRYNYQFEADAQAQQGNYAQALDLYLRALELAPEDAELSLDVGVMYEALQRPDDAAQQYAEAETRYETHAAFQTARAQQYIRLGWYERAADEALAATLEDDRYALAQCTLGSAYEGLGRKQDAMAALWVCADLASEQGQDELYVHAKMLLGTLMQQPG
jgi:tetratricopeptide (TPR) repeat protein